MRLLRHIRFSLRTLVLFVLLAGSGMGLWFKWDPWVLGRKFEVPQPNPWRPMPEAEARLSHDKTMLCLRAGDGVWRMYDANTGAQCWTWKCPSDDFLKLSSDEVGIKFVGDDLVAIKKLIGPRRLLRTADGSTVEESAPEAGLVIVPPEYKSWCSLVKSLSPDGQRRIERVWSEKVVGQSASAVGWSLSDPTTNRQIAYLPATWEARGSCFSLDGQRFATAEYGGIVRINDSTDGRLLVALRPFPKCRCVEFSDDGETLVIVGRLWNAAIYHRRRPEYWWGVAWLPEFWLTVVFAGAFVWSVRRDRRTLQPQIHGDEPG